MTDGLLSMGTVSLSLLSEISSIWSCALVLLPVGAFDEEAMLLPMGAFDEEAMSNPVGAFDEVLVICSRGRFFLFSMTSRMFLIMVRSFNRYVTMLLESPTGWFCHLKFCPLPTIWYQGLLAVITPCSTNRSGDNVGDLLVPLYVETHRRDFQFLFCGGL